MNDAEKSVADLHLEISKRIRDLRHQKGWSLEKLAQKTGLSKGYLSQIENREKAPTISTLSNIAYSLGTDVRNLLTGEAEENILKNLTITRVNERQPVIDPRLPPVNEYESITFKKHDRMIDAYVIILGHEMQKKYTPHEGEELLYALEGRSEFTYDGQVFILEPGDCVYFDASRPHNIRGYELPAKVLSVFPRHRF